MEFFIYGGGVSNSFVLLTLQLMAGIGEASAIIAVAQAGIGLSKVIIAYASDVRDAPKSVSRIGNEINSTSGRLEEIAEIIRENPSTQLLLDTAVRDAARCSCECELILAQVGNLLVKGGWKTDTTGLSKDDIDTSVVASLKWPFLKTRLETPRVELQRIKADLSLLFNVAMARKSSTPLTNEYAQKIPILAKKQKEAARRAEEARHRARESQDHDYGTPGKTQRAPSTRGSEIAEEDFELSEQFREFQLQRAKELEDRKIQERAALLQTENDNKTRAEEAEQRETARKAVEDYKQEQEKLKAKTMAREKQLSDELLALGLGPEQIASIMAVPSLNIADIYASNAASRRQSPESQRTSLSGVTRKLKSPRKSRGGFPINFFPWRQNHSSNSYDSESDFVNSNSQENISNQGSRGNDDAKSIELWLVDEHSRQHTELAVSERWLNQKLERIEKSNVVWHRFAQLQPMSRVAIQDFLKVRNEALRPEHAWKLIHIGLPRRMKRTSIFGHHHGGQLVRLIISRRNSINHSVHSSVVVVKRGVSKASPPNVRSSTYLSRHLVSTSAIRASSYDYEETFAVPSDDAASELKNINDKTHVMIPEALTLEQVNRLISLTRSLMEHDGVPLTAQLSLTYTAIEHEVPYNHKDRAFSHDRGKAQAKFAPAHESSENQQRGHRTDRAREALKELQTRLEQRIEDLIQRRSLLGEVLDLEERVLLQEEFDSMIRVHENRLAKLDLQVANVDNYGHPIPRDERKVVFKDHQIPKRHTGYGKEADEESRERVKKTFGPAGYDEESIEKILKKGEKRQEHGHSKEIRIRDLTRPTYAKVHHKYLSPETLDEYNLPWEWGENDDSEYIIIKQWIPPSDQKILFEHTKKLHERLIHEKGTKSHYKKKSELEKPKRDASFQARETWPDDRKSHALILREPYGHHSSHEYPSRKSTYDDGIRDDGIRAWGNDVSSSSSPPPSPISRPPQLSKSFSYGAESLDRSAEIPSRPPNSLVARQTRRPQAPRSVESYADDVSDVIHPEAHENMHEISVNEADLIAETLSRYTTYKPDDDITADAKTSPSPAADAPERPASSANHDEDNVYQNNREKNIEQDDNPTNHHTRYPNRSPSQSETERELIRKADTQLYEANSEGSGKEARTFERRDTWRRPTVEDEDDIVVEEEVD